MDSNSALDNLPTIFVGDLASICDEKKVEELFSEHNLHVVNVKIMRGKKTNVSLNYGFVKLATDDDAKKAIQIFNGQLIFGRPLKVNWAVANVQTAKPSENSENSIYVKYRSNSTIPLNEEMLRNMFSAFGPVRDISLKANNTNSPNGYFFVHYMEGEEGLKAAMTAIATMSPVYVHQHVEYVCEASQTMLKIWKEKIRKQQTSPTCSEYFDLLNDTVGTATTTTNTATTTASATTPNVRSRGGSDCGDNSSKASSTDGNNNGAFRPVNLAVTPPSSVRKCQDNNNNNNNSFGSARDLRSSPPLGSFSFLANQPNNNNNNKRVEIQVEDSQEIKYFQAQDEYHYQQRFGFGSNANSNNNNNNMSLFFGNQTFGAFSPFIHPEQKSLNIPQQQQQQQQRFSPSTSSAFTPNQFQGQFNKKPEWGNNNNNNNNIWNDSGNTSLASTARSINSNGNNNGNSVCLLEGYDPMSSPFDFSKTLSSVRVDVASIVNQMKIQT